VIKVIQLRLVAETQADALTAIAALRDAIGSSRVALSSPHEGRKGGWLSYGTLQVEDTAPTPAPPDPTRRIAVTGKTRKLRGP
jgi:hypothetical protein